MNTKNSTHNGAKQHLTKAHTHTHIHTYIDTQKKTNTTNKGVRHGQAILNYAPNDTSTLPTGDIEDLIARQPEWNDYNWTTDYCNQFKVWMDDPYTPHVPSL